MFDEVRRLMIRLPKLAPIADGIEVSGDLWAAGMDSLTSVELLLALEQHFEVELPDEALTSDTFRSIESLSTVLTENGAVVR